MNIWQEALNNNTPRERISAVYLKDNGAVETYTFGDFFDNIERISKNLRALGIAPGDRVAIASPSCPMWNATYFAILSVGATAVMVDYSLPADELCLLIDRAFVSAMFCSTKCINSLSRMTDIPTFDIERVGVYLTACKRKRISDIPGDTEIASIIYSSGTTKTASGVMHTHTSSLTTVRNCAKCNKINSSDRMLAILPNSHIYGLYTQVLLPGVDGLPVCFLESLRPQHMIDAFTDFKPTIVPAVPMLYDSLKNQIIKKINSDEKTKKLFDRLFPICLNLRRRTGINLGPLVFRQIHRFFGGKIKILCSGGAPISQSTADFYYGTGFLLLITYGATETNIPTIGNYGRHVTTDTCGIPYPGVECKISETGEILLKSPYFMLGYFNDREATENAFDADGWFMTGDIGEIDNKGHIKILGRCKDNIVLSSGKKVIPTDVETLYSDIEGIQDFVVCGVPIKDSTYDEIHAFVVSDGSADTAALTKRIKERSASVPQSRRIAQIHFMEEIPKTALKKPKRYLLRQIYLTMA